MSETAPSSRSSPPRQPRLPRPLLAGLIVTGLLVVVSALAFRAARQRTLDAAAATGTSATAAFGGGAPLSAPPGLPRLYPAPEFSLPSHTGETVTAAGLKGKVWVASFVFVSCAGICPMMNARTAALSRTFASEAGVRFVAFDVDPERDSPAAIAAHARELGADGTRWVFLRPPDAKAIRTLSREGFKLAIEDAEGAGAVEPILHSSRFVLVDRAGGIRGYYDASEEPAMRKLEADIRTLLGEKPPA